MLSAEAFLWKTYAMARGIAQAAGIGRGPLAGGRTGDAVGLPLLPERPAGIRPYRDLCRPPLPRRPCLARPSLPRRARPAPARKAARPPGKADRVPGPDAPLGPGSRPAPPAGRSGFRAGLAGPGPFAGRRRGDKQAERGRIGRNSSEQAETGKILQFSSAVLENGGAVWYIKAMTSISHTQSNKL